MARDEAPPFDRGQTYYQGGTIDSNDLGGVNLEGQEWEFEDLDYSSAGANAGSPGVPAYRNPGRKVRVRCVRNVSGIALLPGRLVSYQLSAGQFGNRVDGYTTTTAAPFAGVVDDFLPAAGVPNNDVFFIVIHGPALVLDPLAALAAVLAIGDQVVAITAATSGSTTAGRFQTQDLSGATSLLANQIINAVGRAMTARTTANTGGVVTSTLIDVRAGSGW